MWSNVKTLTAAIVFLGAASLAAQDAAIPPGAVNINLPDNSPLALKSFTMADSRAVARESAMVNDFSASGELSGRLMLTAPGGIAASCASRLVAPRNTIAAVSAFTLFHIYFRHRDIARFRVRVTSS